MPVCAEFAPSLPPPIYSRRRSHQPGPCLPSSMKCGGRRRRRAGPHKVLPSRVPYSHSSVCVDAHPSSPARPRPPVDGARVPACCVRIRCCLLPPAPRTPFRVRGRTAAAADPQCTAQGARRGRTSPPTRRAPPWARPPGLLFRCLGGPVHVRAPFLCVWERRGRGSPGAALLARPRPSPRLSTSPPPPIRAHVPRRPQR
jgi:hypothetical protein